MVSGANIIKDAISSSGIFEALHSPLLLWSFFCRVGEANTVGNAVIAAIYASFYKAVCSFLSCPEKKY